METSSEEDSSYMSVDLQGQEGNTNDKESHGGQGEGQGGQGEGQGGQGEGQGGQGEGQGVPISDEDEPHDDHDDQDEIEVKAAPTLLLGEEPHYGAIPEGLVPQGVIPMGIIIGDIPQDTVLAPIPLVAIDPPKPFHGHSLPIVPDRPLLEFKFKPPELSFNTGLFLGINLGLVVMALVSMSLGLWVIFDSSAISTIFQISDEGDVEGVETRALKSIGATLLLYGLISGFVSTFGVCGCVQSHPRCLKLYSNYMVGLIVLEILMLIIIAAKYKDILIVWFEEIQALMLKQYDGKKDSTKLITLFMDQYQMYFECCGPFGWEIFINTPWYSAVNGNGSTGAAVDYHGLSRAEWLHKTYSLRCKDKQPENGIWLYPYSCCSIEVRTQGLDDPNCLCNGPLVSNTNTNFPCFKTTVQVIWDQLFLVLGIVVTLFSIEITVITNAMAIAKKVEKAIIKRILLVQIAKEVAEMGSLGLDPMSGSVSRGELGVPAEPRRDSPAGMTLEPAVTRSPGEDPSAMSLPVDPSAMSLPVDPSAMSLPEDPSAISLPAEDPSASSLPEDPSALSLPEDPSTSLSGEDPSSTSLSGEDPSSTSLYGEDPSSTSLGEEEHIMLE